MTNPTTPINGFASLRRFAGVFVWLLAGACAAHAGSGPAYVTAPQHTFPPFVHHVAVFGDDDRVPLPSNLRELEHSIGLVTSDSERTVCTGFCVGRRTVATAAHCLFRTSGERSPDLASYRFVVGPEENRKAAALTGRTTGAHRQHVIAGAVDLRVTPPIDATHDWALMRLDAPVCDGHSLLVENARPAQIDAMAARNRLLQIAFHGDRSDWRLAVSRSCRTKADLPASVREQIRRDFADTSSLVLHDCDTGLASSGSPLLALRTDHTLRVFAMNVGTYQQTRYLVTGRSVTRRYKPATVANTGVSGDAFADHILAFTRADILDDLRGVSDLQSALNKAGFEAGAVDGIFGKRTRAALIAFETMMGRSALGLATRQVLRDVKLHRVR